MIKRYTTISVLPETKTLIDMLFIEYQRFSKDKKLNFIHKVFEYLSKSSLDTFSFFLNNIKQKYPETYEIAILPALVSRIDDKVFYNIYAELKDYSFNVAYTVSDNAKALLFIKPEILSRLIR